VSGTSSIRQKKTKSAGPPQIALLSMIWRETKCGFWIVLTDLGR
jgi:hypothetical protein